MENLSNDFTKKDKKGFIKYLNIVMQFFGYIFFSLILFTVLVFIFNPLGIKDEAIFSLADYYFKNEIANNPDKTAQMDNLYRLLSNIGNPEQLELNKQETPEYSQNDFEKLPAEVQNCVIKNLGKEKIEKIAINNYMSEEDKNKIAVCFKNFIPGNN